MSLFLNNSAIAYRNWRAIFAALGLAGILVWAKMSQGEFVRRDRVMATAVSVTPAKNDSTVKFELPDGKHVILIIGQKVPKVGEKRPVFIDVYNNDKSHVSYDRMEWALNY